MCLYDNFYVFLKKRVRFCAPENETDEIPLRMRASALSYIDSLILLSASACRLKCISSNFLIYTFAVLRFLSFTISDVSIFGRSYIFLLIPLLY